MMLAPAGPGLLLYKLRYPKEVRAAEDVPDTDGLEADEAQLALAQTLVDSMAASFGDLALEDRYKDALTEVITAKIEGKEVVTVAEEEVEVVDIMTALKASIEQAKAVKEPMKKATGKKAAAGAAKEKASAPRRKKTA